MLGVGSQPDSFVFFDASGAEVLVLGGDPEHGLKIVRAEREQRRVFGKHGSEDCLNAKGNFHFERTVRYRRSNDENQEVLEV